MHLTVEIEIAILIKNISRVVHYFCCIVGGTAFIMDIWGDKSALYLQMLYVCILIGCTISPQMVKPFLADGMDVTTTKDIILGNTSAVVNIDNSTLVSDLNNTETFKGVTNFETQISYGFLIIGLFILLGAVLHFCHLGYIRL